MNQTAQMVGIGLLAASVLWFLMRPRSSRRTSLDKKFSQHQLTEKKALNHNTYVLRFALPSPSHILGLPIGKHMKLKFTDSEGEDITRAYTPISSDDDAGFFELLIKVYENGKMTQHLKSLEIGQTISIQGPVGKLEYVRGVMKNSGAKEGETKDRKVRHLGMIAGGTGITPMLQIIREIVKNQKTDKTQVSLIFANVTEADILLREELERLSSSNFKVYFTLDRPSDSWKGRFCFQFADLT